jgi:formate dehydrogenase subunit gamma
VSVNSINNKESKLKVHTNFMVLCLMLLVFQARAADPPPPPSDLTSISPGADLWREVRQRDGMVIDGISQVKGVDSGVLINAQGDKWARFRVNNPVKHAPTVIIAVVLVILLFYVIRGKVGIEGAYLVAWCCVSPISSEFCTGLWRSFSCFWQSPD